MATMPMSITFDAGGANAVGQRATASSGPDSRPSRPMANVSRPRSRASEPSAWPTARTTSGVSVLADDAADVVGLEDFGWKSGHGRVNMMVVVRRVVSHARACARRRIVFSVRCAKKSSSRRGSQSDVAGKRHRREARRDRHGRAARAAPRRSLAARPAATRSGTNGSFLALSTSVGSAMLAQPGLATTRASSSRRCRRSRAAAP